MAGGRFILAIAEEFAPQCILVNAVNPALVGWHRRWLVRRGSAQPRRISGIPPGWLCTTEDVADMVIFLASEQDRVITDSLISMDGAQRQSIMDV